MFGPHLMLDAFGCDRPSLGDLARLCELLVALCDSLGLARTRAPQVHRYAGQTPEDWGISGLVFLKGGRLSVHSFPEKGFLSLDLFGAAPFDAQTVERFIVTHLGATHVEKSLLMRERPPLEDAPSGDR